MSNKINMKKLLLFYIIILFFVCQIILAASTITIENFSNLKFDPAWADNSSQTIQTINPDSRPVESAKFSAVNNTSSKVASAYMTSLPSLTLQSGSQVNCTAAPINVVGFIFGNAPGNTYVTAVDQGQPNSYAKITYDKSNEKTYLYVGGSITIPAHECQGLYTATATLSWCDGSDNKNNCVNTIDTPVSLSLYITQVAELKKLSDMTIPPVPHSNTEQFIHLAPGDSGSATFMLSGAANTVYSIEVSPTVTLSDGSHSIPHNSLLLDGCGKPNNPGYRIDNCPLPSDGVTAIYAGISETIPANTPSGTYTGTATLTVTQK